jgi:hypothetical protein
LRLSFVDLFRKITFFIILFKKGLMPSIAFTIALEGRLGQHLILNEGGTTMVALLDRHDAKRHGCDGEII